MSVDEYPWPDLVSGRLSREVWTLWGEHPFTPKIGDKCILLNRNPVRSYVTYFEYAVIVHDDLTVYGVDNTVPGTKLIPKVDVPREWVFKRII